MTRDDLADLLNRAVWTVVQVLLVTWPTQAADLIDIDYLTGLLLAVVAGVLSAGKTWLAQLKARRDAAKADERDAAKADELIRQVAKLNDRLLPGRIQRHLDALGVSPEAEPEPPRVEERYPGEFA